MPWPAAMQFQHGLCHALQFILTSAFPAWPDWLDGTVHTVQYWTFNGFDGT